MSKSYIVRIPIAGIWSTVVEADSEEAAVKVAMRKEFDFEGLEEIGRYETLYNGYVSFVPLDEAEAEPEEWEDDE